MHHSKTIIESSYCWNTWNIVHFNGGLGSFAQDARQAGTVGHANLQQLTGCASSWFIYKKTGWMNFTLTFIWRARPSISLLLLRVQRPFCLFLNLPSQAWTGTLLTAALTTAKRTVDRMTAMLKLPIFYFQSIREDVIGARFERWLTIRWSQPMGFKWRTDRQRATPHRAAVATAFDLPLSEPAQGRPNIHTWS